WRIDSGLVSGLPPCQLGGRPSPNSSSLEGRDHLRFRIRLWYRLEEARIDRDLPHRDSLSVDPYHARGNTHSSRTIRDVIHDDGVRTDLDVRPDADIADNLSAG